MASLREIRRKIKSLKSTEQITRAMKMVAAARMRRAQQAILSGRPFAVKMEEMVRELSLLEMGSPGGLEGENNSPVAPWHPFFHPGKGTAVGLVLVTADKGLCGGFNTNLIRSALQFLRETKAGRSPWPWPARRDGNC